MDRASVEALLYDWTLWARKEQLPPPGDWFIWLLRTGRGWGKTRTGAEWVINRARTGFKKIAMIGQTKADVRDTMIELGESSIMSISPPWFRPEYEPSKRRLIWPNGAIGVVYSGDEPDQLRGPGHDSAWVDELAKFKYPKETWDNLELGLREGPNPQVVVTTTPRPIPIIRAILADRMAVSVQGHSSENRQNLTPKYVARVLERYEGTRLGRQELGGEVLEDNPNALWQPAQIEKFRVAKAPDLIRVVVAIDPEATSTENSSETGIVVAGLGADRHGYILADHSERSTPQGWASRAIKSYYEFSADRVIGEANNGGEMIEAVLRQVDTHVSYRAVHASQGKRTRAEPVSALYEQGRIHHVGTFPEMEDQMCNWVPGDKSPDRMDALVWALTELMLGKQTDWIFSKVDA